MVMFFDIMDRLKINETEVNIEDLLYSFILMATTLAVMMIGVYNLQGNNSVENNHRVTQAPNSNFIPMMKIGPIGVGGGSGGGGGYSGINYVNHGMQYNYSWGDNLWLIGYIAGGGYFEVDANYGWYVAGNQYLFSGSPFTSTAEVTTYNTNLHGLTGGKWVFTGDQNIYVDIPNSVYTISPNILWQNVTVKGVTVESQNVAITLTFSTSYVLGTHNSKVEIDMTAYANGQVFGEMFHNGSNVINWGLIKSLFKYFTSD